tara:strand:+ start:136 stop:723 length:588 start_codon:yes stop_codon:yes gene_type:complete
MRVLTSFVLLLCSSTQALLLRPTLRVRAPSSVPLATARRISMDESAQLPPFLLNRVSFQTGGSKQANQEAEVLILWNAFKQCYPSDEAAELAVNKNSMTVNPSVNSPTKITGTWALLVERFGDAKATEIITLNPGILTCTASAVATQSDADILNATDMAVKIGENKDLIKLVALGSFLTFFNLVGWRIGSYRGWW